MQKHCPKNIKKSNLTRTSENLMLQYVFSIHWNESNQSFEQSEHTSNYAAVIELEIQSDRWSHEKNHPIYISFIEYEHLKTNTNTQSIMFFHDMISVIIETVFGEGSSTHGTNQTPAFR